MRLWNYYAAFVYDCIFIKAKKVGDITPKLANQGEFIGQTPCIKRVQHHDVIEAAAPHLTRVVSAVSWNDDN